MYGHAEDGGREKREGLLGDVRKSLAIVMDRRRQIHRDCGRKLDATW